MDIMVTIVVPVYKRTEYLYDCIQSILNQNIDKIEIIIVQDGVDEKCSGFLRAFSYEGRIRVIKKSHEGAWAARNKGIEEATGEYICFMDSDDYYATDSALAKLYDAAVQNNVLICGGNIENVYPDGHKEFRGTIYRESRVHSAYKEPQMFGHTRYIYKTDFLRKNEEFYYPLRRYEDPPFILKTFQDAGYYYTITDTVYCCRQYERDRIYSYETVLDIIKGLIACYRIAEDFRLENEKLLRLGITHELESIYEQCCYYYLKRDHDLTELIDELNHIQFEMTGKYLNVLDNNDISKWIIPCFEAMRMIFENKEIVIYGAGNTAKCLLEKKWIDKTKIKNIIVSNALNEQNKVLCGLTVKGIDEVNIDNSPILIVSTVENMTDIREKLYSKGIDDVFFIDEHGIKLISYLVKYGNIYE